MAGEYRVLTVMLDPYGKYLEMMSIDDNGLIIKDRTRLLIPEGMITRWIDYLQNLHSSSEKVIERARKSLWWLFMDSDLKKQMRTCKMCVKQSPSNLSDQIKPYEPAVYPFQCIHMDLQNYGGKQWIIITDQFIEWPLMRNLGKEALSRNVIKSFMMVFADYGIPETIITDGAPQFKLKEFEELCE
jgi:Integrase zinc binding domain